MNRKSSDPTSEHTKKKKRRKKNELRLFIPFCAGVVMLLLLMPCSPPHGRKHKKKYTSLIKQKTFCFHPPFGLKLVVIFSILVRDEEVLWHQARAM